MENPKEKSGFTFEDFQRITKDRPAEYIDGVICYLNDNSEGPQMMSGASTNHQTVFRELFGQLFVQLQGKKCRLYSAPYDVRLYADEDNPGDFITVEPDILVVCDPGKIRKNYIEGAPDLIIEIISPESLRRDRIVKLNKYQKAGVREYWIVDPINKMAEVEILKDGYYYHSAYSEHDKLQVKVLDGCEVDLGLVFSDLLEE